MRNEHSAEPAVILKGDKSSVVDGDFDMIMRAGDISLGVMRQQTPGHAEVYHEAPWTKM